MNTIHIIPQSGNHIFPILLHVLKAAVEENVKQIFIIVMICFVLFVYYKFMTLNIECDIMVV